MPKHASQAEREAEWRQFGLSLWAGTTGFGPIGTIERGRRFRAIDPDGAVLGGCRSLEDAQALLVHVAEARRAAGAPTPIVA